MLGPKKEERYRKGNKKMTETQIWEKIPPHTREYIRRELDGNGIDIEALIALSETSSGFVCQPDEKVITIKEACNIAKCHRSTICRRISDRTLKTTKLHQSKPGAIRIHVSSFEAWLKSR